ncbi:MAG: hypothetical protein ACXWV1_04505 [Chitinophagaceae bacterium]
MQKATLFTFVLLLTLISCKKDNDNFTTGTVDIKAGCFTDSWLIAIDNPNPEKHSFLRNTAFPTATLYNCSNAVFINLPASLAVPGKKIRFIYVDMQVSCLSYSEAPNHITVKNLSGL